MKQKTAETVWCAAKTCLVLLSSALASISATQMSNGSQCSEWLSIHCNWLYTAALARLRCACLPEGLHFGLVATAWYAWELCLTYTLNAGTQLCCHIMGYENLWAAWKIGSRQTAETLVSAKSQRDVQHNEQCSDSLPGCRPALRPYACLHKCRSVKPCLLSAFISSYSLLSSAAPSSLGNQSFARNPFASLRIICSPAQV